MQEVAWSLDDRTMYRKRKRRERRATAATAAAASHVIRSLTPSLPSLPPKEIFCWFLLLLAYMALHAAYEPFGNHAKGFWAQIVWIVL